MNTILFALLSSLMFSFLCVMVLQRIVKKSQIKTCIICDYICMLICAMGQILQIVLAEKYSIEPIYFDYFVYIGTVFLPVSIFFTGKIQLETKIKNIKSYWYMFIIPIISLLILWTNKFHNLFFKEYSINMEDVKYGFFMYIHTIYSYLLIVLGVYYLLKASIKNYGIFSKQSILLVVATSIPFIVNILGTLKIITMYIYYTPLCFNITFLIVTLAILKFDLLERTPIAIQKILDAISDSYVVLDQENSIIDYNKTFMNTFGDKINNIKNKNIFKFLSYIEPSINIKNIEKLIKKSKETLLVHEIIEYFNVIDKYFIIEITSILNKKEYIGAVILFKDITQHKQDLKTIEDNQYIMQRQAQFAILGEFAGGLAHDLNSPLSAVQLDVSTLKKYMNSDKISAEPQVKEVILEMLENIESSLGKMAGTISGVRNQIRSTGDTEKEEFSLKEIIDGIEILFGSILRKNNCRIENLINEDIYIFGEKNKLDRVIGNVIKNSIDAYVENGIKGKILVNARLENDKCIISIEDEAGGMPKEIQETMFKEMKTTKEDNGTGFGLYYSNTIIESSFNGKMSFETEIGKGTIFYIEIPIIKEEK